jgi:hypothetical protein
MREQSFTQTVGANTQDSDPRKLRFQLMSQQPEQLFQQGETILPTELGTDVDLSNAHALGDVETPSVPGPVMVDMSGGVGNKITLNLQPPLVTPPAAEDLSSGDFTTMITRQDATTGTIAGYGFSRMQADGGPLMRWKAPLGNPGAWLKDTTVGDILILFTFSDESSAEITMSGADLAALAIAQGYTGDVCSGTIDVTSLLDSIPAMASKQIVDVSFHLTTAFGGSRGSLWYFMRMRVKDSTNAVVLCGDYFDTSYQNNVSLPVDGTISTTLLNTSSAPQVLLDVYAIVPIVINDVGVPAKASATITQVDFTVNSAIHSTPELASLFIHFTDQFGNYSTGSNFGTFSTLDAPPHTVGTTQTFNPTDTALPSDTRYLFYVGQMFFNQPGPIDVDIPIAATDLIAWATSEGSQNSQSAVIENIAGTALHGYLGYELLSWTISLPSSYSAIPSINSSSGFPYIAFYREDTHQPWQIGSVSNLPTPVANVLTAPSMTIPSNSMNIRLAFSLAPPDSPALLYPLLTTEGYEIRLRNQTCFRFNCSPPGSSRPDDFTSPKFAVRMFGSQGIVNGRQYWTPIPFNVVGVNGLVQHATTQQLDAYPFEDYLPDFWCGSAIIFDNQEYSTPWNYVRFLILPVAENDVSGYVLSITASAREL